MPKGLKRRHVLAGSAVALALAAPVPAIAQEQTFQFNIPAQSLGSALRAFARTSRQQILFDRDLVRGRQSRDLSGSYTVAQALDRLLAGSGLRYDRSSRGAYILRGTAQGASPRSAEAPPTNQMADDRQAAASATAEILVTGRRSFNGDVRRTVNDVQPYVVISGNDIANSGAATVEEYLSTRLPMNTQQQNADLNTNRPNQGDISLRGLSPDQTLILVDGRRIAGIAIDSGAGVTQPNISGIPITAIDRIEILPATAGGIYGGNATGGVINIVLKRNYHGVDIQADYGNAFNSDVGRVGLSVSGGASFLNGRANVLFSATRSHQNSLMLGDRDFQERARELNFVNRPADFVVPTISSTPTFCSTVGAGTTCPTSAPLLVLDPAYGGTALNTRIGSVPDGYGGLTTSGIAPLVGAAGQYNFAAADYAATLVPERDIESYSLALHAQITPSIDVFFDAGLDRITIDTRIANRPRVNLPAADPNNPFQQPIVVQLSFPNLLVRNHSQIETDRARGGVVVKLPRNWTAGLEYGWSRNANSTNATGEVTVVNAAYLRSIALRDLRTSPTDHGSVGTPNTNTYGPFEASLNDAIFRFAGPLARVWGGPITLSGYLERRWEHVDAGITRRQTPTSDTIIWYAPKSQTVTSAYAEVRAPLLSPARGGQRLELLAALRHDEYRSRSSIDASGSIISSVDGPFPNPVTQRLAVRSTNFTLGLEYAPIPDVTIRVSYGTGFLPPNLGQIATATGVGDLSIYFDPRRGGQALGSTVTTLTGGSNDLQPERSRSLSAGLILQPRWVPGFRLSIDYTRIRKSDEITPLDLQNLVNREDDFPGRIIRGANLPGDPVGQPGPITQIDDSYVNVASTNVRAYDFRLDYSLQTSSVGSWQLFAAATLQNELSRRIFASDPLINLVGFRNGPLEWRANFGFSWEYGPFHLGWNAQLYDQHSVCNSMDATATCTAAIQRQGSDHIPTQFYQDVFLAYKVHRLRDMELRFGIQNIFNERPPLVATENSLGFDLYGDPRLRRFTFQIRTRL